VHADAETKRRAWDEDEDGRSRAKGLARMVFVYREFPFGGYRVATLFPRRFRAGTRVHRSLSISVSIHTRNAPCAAINQNLGDPRGTVDRGFTRFTCRRRPKETRRPRVTKRSASRDFYGPVSARKYRRDAPPNTI